MDLRIAAVIALMLSATPVFAASVLIEDMTWPEVREAIASGKTTAIYYAGSTEQNGPHMVIGKHNFVAHEVARRIADRLGNALVYPIMPYAPTGDASKKTGHMRFPGSVTVSDETYAAVANDVASSAIAAGFKTIVLMGDHGGGQKSLQNVAERLDGQWSAQGVHVHYVPDLYYKSQKDINAYLEEHGYSAGAHAGMSDTSQVMALDRERKWIRTGQLAPGNSTNGVDGDPGRASAQLGAVFIDIKVKNAVAQIREAIGRSR